MLQGTRNTVDASGGRKECADVSGCHGCHQEPLGRGDTGEESSNYCRHRMKLMLQPINRNTVFINFKVTLHAGTFNMPTSYQ